MLGVSFGNGRELGMSAIHIGGNIYAAGNIGDDAVLQGLLGLFEYAPFPENVSISTSVESVGPLPFVRPNIAVCDYYDWGAVCSAMANSSCVVVGGGTMVGDELGTVFPLLFLLKRVAMAKCMGKHVMLAGIGANQPRTTEGRRLAKELIAFCDMITVRDTDSFAVCRRLGAGESRLRLAADPAFSLRAQETERTRAAKTYLRGLGKRLIGINVVNEAWGGDASYKRSIAECIDRLMREEGYFPVFFCNEIREGGFYDQTANEETAALLKSAHGVLPPVYYSPCEMIDIMGSFSFVLSMRMHGLIFSAIAGVPFATVSRIDKVDNFMAQFGFAVDGTVGGCDADKMLASMRRRADEWGGLRDRVASKVAELCARSQVSGQALSDLLALPAKRRIRKATFDYVRFGEADLSLLQHVGLLTTGRASVASVARHLAHGLCPKVVKHAFRRGRQ